MHTDNQAIIDQIQHMKKSLFQHDPVYWPSPMWIGLASEHEDLIARYGFGEFKRTVNRHYFQSMIGGFRNTQQLSVLKGLVRRGHFPFLALLSRIERLDKKSVTRLFRGGRFYALFAYKMFVANLWQYAQLYDGLGVLRNVEEPTVGNPIRIFYRGRLLSQDLATSCMEINTIAKSCPDLYDIRTVAEIGAGYGRLACLFVKFLPHVQYHIFDIPPALAIAQNYLLQCLGPSYVSFFKDDDSPQPQLVEDNRQPRVKCFLPHQLEHFPEKYFDLVINISSIDEMRGDQIQHYFRMMDRLARKYIYLKGFSKVDMGNGVIADVRSYPYGKAWSQVYFGQDKVIPTFVEQVFHVES